MSRISVKTRTKTKTKTERPKLYKVILLNDDFTPREFVVLVLKAVFRMNETTAYRVMLTAHQKGACVIAVYTRDVAETKAKEADRARQVQGLSALFHHRAGGVAAPSGFGLLISRAASGPGACRCSRRDRAAQWRRGRPRCRRGCPRGR
jgi:ATP-dependent Clp protease adaptor protein ClpS